MLHITGDRNDNIFWAVALLVIIKDRVSANGFDGLNSAEN